MKDALAGIAASLYDRDLPKPSRVTTDGKYVTVWFGGHGWHLGSTKIDGVPLPADYRGDAVETFLQLERVHRMELAYWAEMDAEATR